MTTSFRFATVRVATGPQIHYAEQGSTEGKPILFCTDGRTPGSRSASVAALLPRRFHILIPDQRGFGNSERPDGSYGVEQFAADAVGFLDALSIQRAAFVGHSFGSFVTRRVAIHPERVARMVLIGTAVSAVSRVTREVQSALRDLQDPVPVEFARDFQAGTVYVPLPESFFERIVSESLKLPAHLWREVLDGVLAYDDVDQIHRITTPTLLIWGEHDALFARDDQDRLVAGIRGAKLKIYQETGHCPNWERPEEVAADLEEFLAADVSDPR